MILYLEKMSVNTLKKIFSVFVYICPGWHKTCCPDLFIESPFNMGPGKALG